MFGDCESEPWCALTNQQLSEFHLLHNSGNASTVLHLWDMHMHPLDTLVL